MVKIMSKISRSSNCDIAQVHLYGFILYIDTYWFYDYDIIYAKKQL